MTGRSGIVPGIVVVAVVTWGTAIAVVMLPAAALGIACGAAVAVGVLLLALHVGKLRSWVAIVAIAGAGALAVAAHVALTASERAAVAAAAGRSVQVTGTIATKVEPAALGALRFELDAHSITWGGESHPVRVSVNVRVSPADVSGGMLDLGSDVVVSGTAQPARTGERAVLVVSAERGVRVERAPPGILRTGALLRDGFVALTAGLPAPGGSLLPGLAVGDTSAVGEDLDRAMKETSLSHLTAVSGANCAVVVGLAFAAASACRAPRWSRLVVAGATLAGFVVIVTPEPSVLRAAAMAAIALLALAWDRRNSGLVVLSLAVVVLLVVDPWLATSLGFALSASATAALLVLARPLAAGLARWMPRPFALGLSVPLAAQLVCGPLLVLIDPAVPIYGVFANLIAGPAAPVATVGGLAACLSAGVPFVGVTLAWIAWLPATWVASTAHAFATLPGARMPWAEGWPGAVTLAAVGGAIVLAVSPRSSRRRIRRLQVVAVFAVASLGGAGAGFVGLAGVLAPATVPPGWSVAQCDVGQGDAVVLRSAGEIMLIDTGPDQRALAHCLERLGVRRIDILVLTHFDTDHVGGVDAVRERVGLVVHGPPDGAADAALLARLEGSGARVVAASAGVRGAVGTAQWRVLWPRAPSPAFGPGNDASVVLEVGEDAGVRVTVPAGGMPRGLYLGDMSASAQRALLAGGGIHGPYDIVKVSHHGSADQAPELYERVRARVALVGVGADNTFGHPRAEALELVADAVLIRSDRDGIAVIRTGASGLTVWRDVVRDAVPDAVLDAVPDAVPDAGRPDVGGPG